MADVQEFDIRALRDFFSTPKNAYNKLTLDGFIPWQHFYRLWHMGRAPRPVGLFVTSAWDVWQSTFLTQREGPFSLTPSQLTLISDMTRDQ